MLKVVGASWFKTRISTYIIAGAAILSICALFIAEMEKPQYDGTYCATSYWSRQYSFRVEFWGQRNDLAQVPKGAARTCYKDSTFQNGWSQIEVETQPEYPDWVQAYAAGMLEGALTWSSIHKQWLNTVQGFCEQDEDTQGFCIWLRDYLATNYANIKKMSDDKSKVDHYWYQIRLFFHQLEGLEHGWKLGVKRSRADYEIEFVDFLMLNAAPDIHDIRIYYENFVKNATSEYEYEPHSAKASMLLKSIESEDGTSRKVLIGHSSEGSYASMLRVLKKYKFHYHFSTAQKTNEVSGVDIAFTSYPASLASSDDFYIIGGRKTKLTVAGIRLENRNLDLWKTVEVNHGVLLAARVMSANRLAHSGRTWAKVMSRNPGFGSKQWLILDTKRLQQTAETGNEIDSLTEALSEVKKLHLLDEDEENMSEEQKIEEAEDFLELIKPNTDASGITWIVDQLPGRLHAEDMTDEIIFGGGGLWTGAGMPFFKEMQEASLIDPDEISRRSLQFVNSTNITDLGAVAKALQTRAYRGDLAGENASAFGNIDIKLFSQTTTVGDMEFSAIAGPLYYNNKIQHNQLQQKQTEQKQQVKNADMSKSNAEKELADELSEIELFAERRTVRDDIRANAMAKLSGPFKWSKSDLDVEHNGHPDVWNFQVVSPKWAWKHDTA